MNMISTQGSVFLFFSLKEHLKYYDEVKKPKKKVIRWCHNYRNDVRLNYDGYVEDEGDDDEQEG